MTMSAKEFGKDISNFMRSPETKEYMKELSRAVESTDLIVKVPGNRYIPDRGTWAHPKLAVFFARWLDVRFAVACDARYQCLGCLEASIASTGTFQWKI